MARNVANIVITANTAAARSELVKLNRAFGDVADRSSRMKAALKSAAVPSGVLLAGMTVYLTGAVKAASDYNETLSKTGVYFGRNTDAMVKWAAAASSTMGLAKTEALDAASSFAIVGRAAGKGGQDLVKWSQSLTQLSADLTSQLNLADGEAIQRLLSGLAGETEPLRRLGIYVTDQTLRQRALKLGLIKTTKEALKPQTKILALHAEIMRQTTKVQGDYARTADGAANSTRSMLAALRNVKASVGAAFLRMLQPLLPLLTRLADFAENHPRLFTWLVGGIAALAAAGTAAGGLIYLAEAVAAVGGAIAGIVGGGPILAAIVAGLAAVGAGFLGLWDNSQTFRDLVGWIANTAAPWIGQKLTQAFRWLQEATGNAGNVMGTLRTVLGWVGMALLGVWTQLFMVVDWMRRVGITTAIANGFRAAWEWVTTAVDLAKLSVQAFVFQAGNVKDATVKAVRDAWNGVTSSATAAKDAVVRFVEKLGNIGTGTIGSIARAWDAVKDAIGRVIDKVREVTGLFGSVRRPSWLPSWTGLSIQGPPVLYAAGGYSARSFQARAVSSGTGTVVNVTVNALDAEGAARAVRRVLLDHDRRQGRIGRFA